MGFRNPLEMSGRPALARGRLSALRNEFAREQLAALVPILLASSRQHRKSGRRCRRVRPFPARSAWGRAAVLAAAAESRSGRLIALILGTAPRLADILARYPHVMDRCWSRPFSARCRTTPSFRAADAISREALNLRGFPRPAPPVRTGADVPDRRAHPVRHGFGRAGRRGLRDPAPT